MLSMHNPFPAIGKIMKYEFKHSSKILVPLYITMIVISGICGAIKQPLKVMIDAVDEIAIGRTLFFAFVCILLGLLVFSIYLTSIIIFCSRFYKSMLGDEAYMTLTLPVTIGEHITGRLITDFIWTLVYSISTIISIVLIFIKDIANGSVKEFLTMAYDEIVSSVNFNVYSFFTQTITASIVSSTISFLMIILFIYFIISVSHLFKNLRGFGVFITIIVCIFIHLILKHFFAGDFLTNFSTLMNTNTLNEEQYLNSSIIQTWKTIGLYSFYCVFFTVSSYFIFKKHLNLE